MWWLGPSGESRSGQFWWFLVACAVVFAYAAVLLAFTVGLFGARGWFGVGRREGWRTLCAEGLWSLVVTALLELGTLAVVALALMRPSPY